MSLTFGDALAATILGIVEGLTEFIPVSSTGHLIVAADLLGRDEARTDTFIVVIQLGAILAVCWLYRAKIAALLGAPLARPTLAFAARLAVAFLPAAVVGLLFHAQIKQYLFAPLTVAFALVAGGIAIIVIERAAPAPRVASIDQMGYREALWVGIAQVLALFPGVSRSAATIMGGRLAGMGRLAATEFSFFLAIPVMLAAFCFDLYASRELLSLADLPYFALGFGVSFASAMVAVRWLLGFIASHDFTWFGWYRIAAGLAIAALALS